MTNSREYLKDHQLNAVPYPSCIAIAAIALLLLLSLGPCTTTGPPEPQITPEQIQLLNQSIDALHEEVAAARAPNHVSLVLFVASVLLPLPVGVWMLTRAERSVIGADEAIRTLVRLGASDPVLRHYLDVHAAPPRLPCTPADPANSRVLPRPREPHRSGRRRHRERDKHQRRQQSHDVDDRPAL